MPWRVIAKLAGHARAAVVGESRGTGEIENLDLAGAARQRVVVESETDRRQRRVVAKLLVGFRRRQRFLQRCGQIGNKLPVRIGAKLFQPQALPPVEHKEHNDSNRADNGDLDKTF